LCAQIQFQVILAKGNIMATKKTGVWKSILSAIMALCFFLAQTLPAQAFDLTTIGEMDLSSTNKTLTAPTGMQKVNIVVGGRGMTVAPGSSVTAAQAAAVSQVLNSGRQSLLIGAGGNATGGRLILRPTDVSVLTIPRGVSVIGVFNNSQALNVAGNLSNSGKFFALSTNPANSVAGGALITATNIFNNAQGLITTVLPSTGIMGFSTAISSLNLSLIATNSLINSGIISSSRNLNLIAGTRLENVGTGALLSAQNSVNIATPSLSNGGLINAGSNININQQATRSTELASILSASGLQSSLANVINPGNLQVANSGGVMQALQGSINLDLAGTRDNELSIIGGDFLSEQLNINALKANAFIAAQSISGVVNVNAGSGNVGAVSDLILGEVNFSGDPTFWSTGNITITANQTNDESITYVAGGNIIFDTTSGAITIDSTDVATQGFPITLIAGAKILTASTTPFPGQLLPGETLQVTGASTTGGSILCST
jgi:hypothetical protein